MADCRELMWEQVREFGIGPVLAEMPRKTLREKGIDGPTAAHFIEEIHTPDQYAFITCTTGTSALQNVVGVTHTELPARMAAGKKALERLKLKEGSRVLITYPPLVSVFGGDIFSGIGIRKTFIIRPSRDALTAALLKDRPDAVIGESSFLRAALEDAKKMGVFRDLPEGLKLIAAGTPMDPGLRETSEQLRDAEVHDLYGCQEFGWICLDGKPLREDVVLWKGGAPHGYAQLLVGGLATGDCFQTAQDSGGHENVIFTETRIRAEEDAETIIETSRAEHPLTVRRAAKSVLRCKAKIVRVSKELKCGADSTAVRVLLPDGKAEIILSAPEQTKLMDDLIEAQRSYQKERGVNPVWNKQRKLT